MAEITNKSSKQKKNTSGQIRILMLIIAISVILLATGNVISKYVYKNGGQSTVSAHEFYFTSDVLSEDGEKYTLSANTDKILVELSNSEDNLRYSTIDVLYGITVNDGENIYTANGRLAGNSKTTRRLEISENGDIKAKIQSGKTYTVTAVGQNGYEITLKATFTVLPESAVIYKYIEDEEYYVTLSVWAQNVKGNVKVTYPNEFLAADNTDDAMQNVKSTDASFTDSMNFTDTYSSHKYRFFKKDLTKEYTADDFNVVCGSITAAMKVPEK